MTERPRVKLRLIVLPAADRGWVLDEARYNAHIANMKHWAPGLDVEIIPRKSGWSDIPHDAFILADVDEQHMRGLEREPPAVRSRCIFIDRSHARSSPEIVYEEVLRKVLKFGFAGSFPMGLGSPMLIGTSFAGRSEISSRCPPEAFRGNEPLETVTQDQGTAAVMPVVFWNWLAEYLAQARALLG